MKILIYGAGSIGNHYANGFIDRDHDVNVTDISDVALERMKNDIYPQRYGDWNDKINLISIDNVRGKKFDLVFIGTPPVNHMELSLKAIDEHNPKIIHIEKPISTPDLSGVKLLYQKANDKKIVLLNGYNHNLTQNVIKAKELIDNYNFGKPLIMNSNVNEHWGGIFEAHPWIKNLKDTYLSNFKLGGGAMSEHSHGINLWQTFSDYLNMGRIDYLTSNLVFEKTKDYEYDSIMSLNVKSEKGLVGNITQDVVTKPHKKNLEIIFEKGYINIINNFKKNIDRVEYCLNSDLEYIDFPKNRKDDFLGAIINIENVFDNDINNEISMSFNKAIETINIIKSSIKSNYDGVKVKVDYLI